MYACTWLCLKNPFSVVLYIGSVYMLALRSVLKIPFLSSNILEVFICLHLALFKHLFYIVQFIGSICALFNILATIPFIRYVKISFLSSNILEVCVCLHLALFKKSLFCCPIYWKYVYACTWLCFRNLFSIFRYIGSVCMLELHSVLNISFLSSNILEVCVCLHFALF